MKLDKVKSHLLKFGGIKESFATNEEWELICIDFNEKLQVWFKEYADKMKVKKDNG
jgi:hypothetical protein